MDPVTHTFQIPDNARLVPPLVYHRAEGPHDYLQIVAAVGTIHACPHLWS